MVFLKMGLIFFGGGFVLVPVLHHRLVTQLGWLNPREFLDGVAISNLTPGPIAVLATFAGYHVAGVAGALVATAALMAPAMGLMWLVSGQYERYRGDPRVQRFLAGVNPAVTGLILSAAVLLQGSAIGSWRGWILCGASLLLLRKFRWHPAFVLAIGSVAGYAGVLP
jgi:chromate transporter